MAAPLGLHAHIWHVHMHMLALSVIVVVVTVIAVVVVIVLVISDVGDRLVESQGVVIVMESILLW